MNNQEERDTFAKLLNTPQGQFLVVKSDGEGDDGQFSYSLEMQYEVDAPMEGVTAIMKRSFSFGDTDVNEIERDKYFAEFGQEDADKIAGVGMGQQMAGIIAPDEE